MTRKSIAVPTVGSNYCYVGSYEVDGDCVLVFNEDGNLLATVGDNSERSARRALVDRSPRRKPGIGPLQYPPGPWDFV
jgi:hypothetical protein